jgi:hypothetical protein
LISTITNNEQSRTNPAREAQTVPTQLLVHAQKLWSSLPPGALKVRVQIRPFFSSLISFWQDELEATVVKRAPTWPEYLGIIIKARDQYEASLNKKPRVQALDMWSYYLMEFHYNKTEKISVPGQYQEVRE